MPLRLTIHSKRLDDHNEQDTLPQDIAVNLNYLYQLGIFHIEHMTLMLSHSLLCCQSWNATKTPVTIHM